MKGKRVLITGASRGIGHATVLLLAQQGAQVMAFARDEAALQNLAAQSDNISFFAGDVANESDVEQVVEKTLSQFGGIDILINNAGIGIFGLIETLSLEDWNKVMDVNVTGTFLLCKHVVPLLKAQQSGHVVIVASDVAKRPIAHGTLYCASKYAQEGLAGSLRKELRPLGIKVTVVYSGLVDTDFHSGPKGEDRKQTWLSEHDIAQSLMYVCEQPQHVVIDELMIHPISQDY
jgi:NADP-dependent 3-hydroxy acid dehydrogenase YdfG